LRKGGGGTNPFVIYDQSATSNGGGAVLAGNNSTGGKTQRGSDLLTSGQKTLVLLVIGTSIESNSCAVPYTVVHGTVIDNYNPYDGHLYAHADPYLGPSTGPGSYPGAAADAIITQL
jgi:hypothetical protein